MKISLLLVSLVFMNFAAAQEATKTCPCPEPLWHVLGGHAFLPSFLIPAPFADSQSTVALSFGYWSDFFPAPLGGGEGKVGAFQPSVQGQVRLIDHLALNFGVNGTILTGLNGESAANIGASASYSWHLGVIYELARSETDVWSLGFDYDRPRAVTVSPLENLDENLASAIGGGDPNFASDKTTNRYTPTVRYAHTFSSVIGTEAFGGLRFDNTRIENADSKLRSVLNLGVLLSSDLKPWIGVPIGLTGAYRHAHKLSDDARTANAFTIGIFETFTPTVNVGFEIGKSSTDAGTTTAGALVAKAFYN